MMDCCCAPAIHARIGIPEIYSIKSIEHIGTEAERNSLCKGDIFRDPYVTLEKSRATKRVTSRIAKCSWRRFLPWSRRRSDCGVPGQLVETASFERYAACRGEPFGSLTDDVNSTY